MWKRSSSRARSPSTPSSRTRAAASSIASGMPSSRRQISAIARETRPAVNCRRGSAARARATNSSTAAAGASDVPSDRQAAEPINLLLGRVQGFLAGHQDAQRGRVAQQDARTHSAAASSRCSQLSRTSRAVCVPQQRNNGFEHRPFITDTHAECLGDGSGD